MFEDGEDEMTTMLDAWFEECVRFLGQNDAWRDDAALIGQEKGRSLSALYDVETSNWKCNRVCYAL